MTLGTGGPALANPMGCDSGLVSACSKAGGYGRKASGRSGTSLPQGTGRGRPRVTEAVTNLSETLRRGCGNQLCAGTLPEPSLPALHFLPGPPGRRKARDPSRIPPGGDGGAGGPTHPAKPNLRSNLPSPPTPARGAALHAGHTLPRAPAPCGHPRHKAGESQALAVQRHPRRPQPRRGHYWPLQPPTKLASSPAGPRAPAPPSPRPRTGSARPRPALTCAGSRRDAPPPPSSAPLRVHPRGTRQRGPRLERARWTELEARRG